MRLGTYLMAAAAVTMTAAPVMAAPVNPAASLSLSPDRTGSVVSHKSELAGGGLIIALVAAAGVIAGIVVVATNHNNDHPASP